MPNFTKMSVKLVSIPMGGVVCQILLKLLDQIGIDTNGWWCHKNAKFCKNLVGIGWVLDFGIGPPLIVKL